MFPTINYAALGVSAALLLLIKSELLLECVLNVMLDDGWDSIEQVYKEKASTRWSVDNVA